MNMVRYCDESKSRHQVAPLIDVVFLLLIYFMVSSTFLKSEGDLQFSIPSGGPVSLPMEAFIQIDGHGAVILDGIGYDASDRDLDGLASQISRLKQIARAQQSPFIVTVDPEGTVLHARIIDVVDACAAAKVHNLVFADNNT